MRFNRALLPAAVTPYELYFRRQYYTTPKSYRRQVASQNESIEFDRLGSPPSPAVVV